MKTKKTWLYLSLVLLAAVLMAPIFKNILYFLIIEPVAYYYWGVKRSLAAIPQILYWLFLIAGLGIIFIFFILKTLILNQQESEPPQKTIGIVQSLSESIAWSNRSVYFSWLIANRLASLAFKILTPTSAHEQNNKISVSDLSKMNWSPPEDIKKYIHAGLDPSFMNARRNRLFHSKKHREPQLNINLQMVLDYLETHLE